ncbi:MAG: pilus assembly protein TadC [Nitrosopumilaceae archaeon]|nr:pilus assembly protein TadC [Nitrosopumilaceae archaeon]NIU01163.1 pilus assembly protein TadC [Nitrosopumilaceae archaeon]NIU87532.1 pilus assembly protein TadC [Nitrosopumilaceae archaeon]NIV65997.1 pilus assembly protein TadC [Nitrosopumilaceae archaeon]NIX61765.1 pilus assembly protein TadC [Nitrosopumilaceae archaeon]
MSLTRPMSKSQKESVGTVHIFSYKLLNDHLKSLYPKLKTLEKSIKQAMMPIPFEVYVSSMVFFSIIAGFCGGIIGFISTQLIVIQPEIISYLVPVISGLSLMAMTFGILQLIPKLKVKTRASKLAEEIPHFIGYMSTLASSGLTLEGIFKAIAKEETEEEIVKDARFITRNIEILGMDLITAIKDLIHRSPSGPYSELLEGAIVTVQSGGDLKEYFNATAKVQLEEKKNLLKKTTESLGTVAEIYTILLIVFPLLAVIMLSIMAIMSPSLAGFDLITLMNILTFAVIPLSGVLMLIMMDTMVPKR